MDNNIFYVCYLKNNINLCQFQSEYGVLYDILK